MPLKTQPTIPIELLTNYTPFSIGENVLVEDINEMFSYSIEEPQSSVNIEFIFGATEAIVGNFVFTNLTTNATLEFILNYDGMTFTTTSPLTFRLEPEQTQTIQVRANVENIQVNMVNVLKEFKISVSNISNGFLVYKSNQSPLQKVSFVDTITLYD